MTKNKSQNPYGHDPTIHPETDSSWACSFCEVLDNVELITYMKFLNTEIWAKNIKNTPEMEFFQHFWCFSHYVSSDAVI